MDFIKFNLDGHDDKKCETCGIRYKHWNCFREHTNFKDDLIEYKCLCCNKNCQHKFEEKLRNDILIGIHFLITTISSFFIAAKRSLSLWIYGWLGKSQWNIIT